MIPKTLFVLLFALVSISTATLARKGYPDSQPKVILVQLRSESARMRGADEVSRPDFAEMIKKDGAEVAAAMIADFKDHFRFCDVYYYMDTDAEKVINKQFGQVLMNADGSLATQIPVDKNSHDYLIVYYGKPVLERSVNEYTGLVICNDSMQQIGYLSTGFNGTRYYKKNFNAKYWYRSEKFDMSYFPMAARLEEDLKDNYIQRKR